MTWGNCCDPNDRSSEKTANWWIDRVINTAFHRPVWKLYHTGGHLSQHDAIRTTQFGHENRTWNVNVMSLIHTFYVPPCFTSRNCNHEAKVDLASTKKNNPIAKYTLNVGSHFRLHEHNHSDTALYTPLTFKQCSFNGCREGPWKHFVITVRNGVVRNWHQGVTAVFMAI